MIIPIRCFTCGKPVGHLHQQFKERTAKGDDAGDVMDDLLLKRYCCRAILMGHVDLIDTAGEFKRG